MADGVAKLGEMASSRADNLRDGVAARQTATESALGLAPRVDHAATGAKAGRLAGMSRERVGGGVQIEDRRLGDVADAVPRIALGPPRRNKSAVSAAGEGCFAAAPSPDDLRRAPPHCRGGRGDASLRTTRSEMARGAPPTESCSREKVGMPRVIRPVVIYPRTRRAIIREDATRPPLAPRCGDSDSSVVQGAASAATTTPRTRSTKHGSPHKSRDPPPPPPASGQTTRTTARATAARTTAAPPSSSTATTTPYVPAQRRRLPQWLHRDERDPRGSSSSTGTRTVFPGRPRTPHRVDSRTSTRRCTPSGTSKPRHRSPHDRRLAFGNRGVARSRSRSSSSPL